MNLFKMFKGELQLQQMPKWNCELIKEKLQFNEIEDKKFIQSVGKSARFQTIKIFRYSRESRDSLAGLSLMLSDPGTSVLCWLSEKI